MTVNELIKVLQETGDEKFRDIASVKIDGTVQLYDEDADDITYEHIQANLDAFDVKTDLHSVKFMF